MSAIISDSKLLLSSSETGVSTAKRTLPVAPTGADMLAIYFRAWAEGYAAGADGYDAANGWDNVDCLGLSFGGAFPTRDGTTALAAKLGFAFNIGNVTIPHMNGCGQPYRLAKIIRMSHYLNNRKPIDLTDDFPLGLQ